MGWELLASVAFQPPPRPAHAFSADRAFRLRIEFLPLQPMDATGNSSGTASSGSSSSGPFAAIAAAAARARQSQQAQPAEQSVSGRTDRGSSGASSTAPAGIVAANGQSISSVGLSVGSAAPDRWLDAPAPDQSRPAEAGHAPSTGEAGGQGEGGPIQVSPAGPSESGSVTTGAVAGISISSTSGAGGRGKGPHRVSMVRLLPRGSIPGLATPLPSPAESSIPNHSVLSRGSGSSTGGGRPAASLTGPSFAHGGVHRVASVTSLSSAGSPTTMQPSGAAVRDRALIERQYREAVDRWAGNVLLYSHAASEDLTTCYQYLERLATETQCLVVAYDYLGYGFSSGTKDDCTEANAYAAIQAVFAHLTRVLRIDRSRIVLVGRSLGSGCAVDLALRENGRGVGGLVLLSPMYSAASAVKGGSLVPAFIDVFNNYKKVEGITSCPVLIVHGDRDEVVPYWHGERLYDLAVAARQALLYRPQPLAQRLQTLVASAMDRYRSSSSAPTSTPTEGGGGAGGGGDPPRSASPSAALPPRAVSTHNEVNRRSKTPSATAATAGSPRDTTTAVSSSPPSAYRRIMNRVRDTVKSYRNSNSSGSAPNPSTNEPVRAPPAHADPGPEYEAPSESDDDDEGPPMPRQNTAAVADGRSESNGGTSNLIPLHRPTCTPPVTATTLSAATTTTTTGIAASDVAASPAVAPMGDTASGSVPRGEGGSVPVPVDLPVLSARSGSVAPPRNCLPEAVRLVTAEGCGHNDMEHRRGRHVYGEINSFLTTYCRQGPRALAALSAGLSAATLRGRPTAGPSAPSPLPPNGRPPVSPLTYASTRTSALGSPTQGIIDSAYGGNPWEVATPPRAHSTSAVPMPFLAFRPAGMSASGPSSPFVATPRSTTSSAAHSHHSSLFGAGGGGGGVGTSAPSSVAAAGGSSRLSRSALLAFQQQMAHGGGSGGPHDPNPNGSTHTTSADSRGGLGGGSGEWPPPERHGHMGQRYTGLSLAASSERQ